MHTGTLTSRRRFLCLTGGLVAGLAVPAIPRTISAAEKRENKEKEADVNPVEDLMREHGVLRRVLLIYEGAMSLVNAGQHLPSGVIADSAGIIRRFIQDYHEKLEEDEIFPRFQKAGQFDDLVRVLLVQHQAGRRLTDYILKLSEPEAVKTQANQEMPAAMQQVYGGRPLLRKMGSYAKHDPSAAMHEFIRMYRPHAAREDTLLFPAFRSIVSPREFDELGEKFEERGKELFGREGFRTMVESVEAIEKKVGIGDLSQFTPKL